ncbi:hypothetical protein PPYR_00462 [Photinus pyralis]|uniref:Malate dehydrogenase n=1 Tax=Photinus pyralis TaxID=7054 RepID=A0A5N4B1L4_PHOPY|nr:uncharacterized protein LOC116166875 [Photinus pyralis]KAB0803492.1 hypothetical protein PPYR_00462 [Photinus pyralis]
MEMNEDSQVVSLQECRRFITECMIAVGVPECHANAQSDLLVEADYRGHYSHGMNRLDHYVKDVQTEWTDKLAVPKVLAETPATAWVDGQNGLGAIVGNFCMGIAIKKAKNVGVGWVCARGANHYGIAGIYAMQAARFGLIGMSFTNTCPITNSTRSKKPAIGVNPLAFAASSSNDSFVLDMSTSTVAVGKIEMKKRKQEKLPEGWALDHEGNITDDPKVACEAQHLLPLGGTELNGGYKGFGLGVMVEMLTGILAGSNYADRIPPYNLFSKDRPRDLGQCFIAVDPKCFAPGFEDRLDDLLDSIRNLDPSNPEKPVIVAGDPEREHMAEVNRIGGIRFCKDQLESCSKLAASLKVAPLKFK